MHVNRKHYSRTLLHAILFLATATAIDRSASQVSAGQQERFLVAFEKTWQNPGMFPAV